MTRRINVVGTSGNGKTSVARALAERLGLPYVELDALHHGPGWTEASDEDFLRAVEAATGGEGWVVDGNYQRKLGDYVVERADTVVWLDQSLGIVLWRLLRRTLRRILRREELWNGNRESWRGAFWGRDSLFAWTIRAYFRNKRQVPAQLARFPELRVVRLRTPREVARFLSEDI
jgi:adenylate kinase family enzyme